MNNLEFRVWHKGISYIFSKPFLLAEYTVLSFLPENEELKGIDRLGYDDFEFDCIEQYTGLKDKNGKKIYEGDIIKLYDKYIGEIAYRIGGFFFEEESGRHTPIVIFNPIDSEVIGNIHENPNY